MSLEEIIVKLSEIGPVRRGQITEQWYTVTDKKGKSRKQGPYYVWTWSDDGEKHTERISAEDINKVRDEIDRGKEVSELFREFFRQKESEARGEVQKKTTCRKSGSAGTKSIRRSKRSGRKSATAKK